MMNPSYCILIYKTDSVISNDMSYYLELGNFVSPNTINTKPFTNNDAHFFSKLFNPNEKKELSYYFFDRHVLFHADDKIIWYAKNVPKTLIYLDGQETFTVNVRLPKMIFCLSSRNQLSVYFISKGDGLDTVVYKANFPNYSSSVCLGKNKIVNTSINSRMSSAEELFFKSPFTQKITNIHKWKKTKIKIKDILKNLV